MNKRFLLLGFLLSAHAAFADSTAFTYQGRLSDNGIPANGRYDLRIILFDVDMFGFPAGGPLTNLNVQVSGGLFTTTIDFVTNVFTGGPRWLEIGVRTNGSAGGFTTLDPRQRLTAVPYAIYAQSAPGGGGINVSNLPVSLTSNMVGSIGNQPLELKVNGVRGLRLEPTADTPNVIGGSSGNSVQPGLVGVTIGGGGTVNPSLPNVVTNGGSFATIAGGYKNTVTNYGGAILGGAGNFVGGSFGAIGAGQLQNAYGDYSWIGGGLQNTAATYASTVGGGVSNLASGAGSTIPGGQGNTAQGRFSLAAGTQARAVHDGSFVWGDHSPASFSSTTSNQFLIRASGGVGINKNNPATALDVNGAVTASGGVTASNLVVNGPAIITGLIRSGSETGTSNAPSPAGLVIRRINSTNPAAGQVVARTDSAALERDGSNAGFLIRYTALAGNLTIACMGIRGDGSPVNFYQTVPNGGAPGTVQVYADAQDVVHFECTFGRTFNANQHLTQVTLSRYSGDNFWSGTVTSTFNQ